MRHLRSKPCPLRASRAAWLLLAPVLLTACGGSDSAPEPLPAPVVNVLPTFVAGSVVQISYDGSSDDLLTGGLGKTGLLAAAAPAFVNPLAPTAAELRRNAIFANYRALIDYTASGGMGRLFGPNIDITGADTLGEGKIAGTEYSAVADDGSGRQNVVLMVQVPISFDVKNPCIVTATSSGSRGVYGAIGTSGDWGLKHGCAVAYADKGSGNGLHDLMTDNVIQVDGTIATAAAATAAKKVHFKADLSDDERSAYNAAFPNRVAYKHAHSQQNPEKDWGRDTLRAVKLAFYVLNEKYGTDIPAQPGKKEVVIIPAKTVVIASSVSNGGGAALAAAEQDTEGLIDGVAVAEPNAQPGANTGLTIKQGAATVATHSKPLVDYFTYANVYQACAALSAQAGLSLNPAFWPAAYTVNAQNRCAALKARGLLVGASLAAQADEALSKLNSYGWQSESNYLHQSHFRFATNAIVVTYVNSYGKFKVTDNICGYSYANSNAVGDVVAQVSAVQAGLFSGGNGVPPTSGVNVIYNDSVGGAKIDFLASSVISGQADFALDGALCMRSLVTGRNAATGNALFGTMKSWSDRVIGGINDVQLTTKLRGIPTIIVAGRNDTLVPVNHAARAYYGKNQIIEAAASKLRYYEVTNAQHFDTFIAFGALLGYDSRFVPLHVYFGRAMDQMWAHLKNGTALPASQVVHTTPRAAGSSVTAANLPAWAATPAVADVIGFASGVLTVPD